MEDKKNYTWFNTSSLQASDFFNSSTWKKTSIKYKYCSIVVLTIGKINYSW